MFFSVRHLEPKPDSSEIIPKLTFGKFTTEEKGEISAGVSTENLGFYVNHFYGTKFFKNVPIFDFTDTNTIKSGFQNDTVRFVVVRPYLNLLIKLLVQKTGFDTTLLTFYTQSGAGSIKSRDFAEPLYLVNSNDIIETGPSIPVKPNLPKARNVELANINKIEVPVDSSIATGGPLEINNSYILTGSDVEYQPLDKNLGPFSSGYPDAIVLHSTITIEDIEKTAAYTKKEGSSGYWHIIIGRDGKIIQLVPFNMKAAHAGISEYNLRNNYNNNSVGIAFQNAGRLDYNGKDYQIANMRSIIPANEVLRLTHKNESEPAYWQNYTDTQIRRAKELCMALMEKFKISEIIGHDDIASDRRTDPGPAFPLTDFQKRLLGETPDSSNKLKMTGKWSTRNVELGEILTIVADYKPNGELSVEFIDSEGKSSKIGHWQVSGDILNEQFSDGQIGKGKIRWISDNSFELTIIDNGFQEYAGMKRNYTRITTEGKPVSSATEYLVGTWEGKVTEFGKESKIIF